MVECLLVNEGDLDVDDSSKLQSCGDGKGDSIKCNSNVKSQFPISFVEMGMYVPLF